MYKLILTSLLVSMGISTFTSKECVIFCRVSKIGNITITGMMMFFFWIWIDIHRATSCNYLQLISGQWLLSLGKKWAFSLAKLNCQRHKIGYTIGEKPSRFARWSTEKILVIHCHETKTRLPSGKQTVCYWKWLRNSGFSH